MRKSARREGRGAAATADMAFHSGASPSSRPTGRRRREGHSTPVVAMVALPLLNPHPGALVIIESISRQYPLRRAGGRARRILPGRPHERINGTLRPARSKSGSRRAPAEATSCFATSAGIDGNIAPGPTDVLIIAPATAREMRSQPGGRHCPPVLRRRSASDLEGHDGVSRQPPSTWSTWVCVMRLAGCPLHCRAHSRPPPHEWGESRFRLAAAAGRHAFPRCPRGAFSLLRAGATVCEGGVVDGERPRVLYARS